jgi:hypothetical protein
MMLRAMIFVETTLAINAIESAHLAVVGQQIDAQTYTEAAAMNRPENGRRINYCAHGGKVTELK